MECVIVDYGMGNVGSVRNMVRRVGGHPILSDDPSVIARATALILPGVGHFRKGMEELQQRGLVPALETARAGGAYILGICLGLQLMMSHSEEGDCDGLGWFDGRVVRFALDGMRDDRGQALRVPHMGWNTIAPTQTHPLFDELPDLSRFYFVHSFFVRPDRDDERLCTTQHGVEFTSGMASGRVAGVQFHPEKSHRFGMALMKRFVEMA